ncbi:MAG: hypothetical protein QM589_10020 [Thermomicrobiales bacterium]
MVSDNAGYRTRDVRMVADHEGARTPIGRGTGEGFQMSEMLNVMVEVGPKGKRTVAYARDWPGWERGDKTEADAIERLLSYRPRYAEVAQLAGLGDAFVASTDIEIVDRYPGTGSTDFWGISFAFPDYDHQGMSPAGLERELSLMQAAWAFFDGVRARVSPEMQKGPRGGGRDRDEIVRHVFGTERDWASKIGVETPPGVMLTPEGLATHRAAYCEAIRAYHAEGKMARKWPLRYLIRHTAYHTLDHAWEMEDKNLSRS